MGKQRLKLAVFDLDGTLIELEHEHFAQQAELTFGRLGIQCPPQTEILERIREQRFTSLFRDEWEQKAFWARYSDGECPPVRLFERSLQALEGVVSRGLAVAIATARPVRHEELSLHLAKTGLLRHVATVSTFYGRSWSTKEAQLRLLCREYCAEPRASMMVGDSEDDLRSALNLGFGLRLGKLGGLTPSERLLAHRPRKLVSCIGEVPEEVDRYHQEGAR